MNNPWQCYGWSVQNFFHCHNLPKDQTTTGHTWDQTQVAQWTDQSTEKDWYKTHNCLISSHHTPNSSKQDNWLIKQRNFIMYPSFPSEFLLQITRNRKELTEDNQKNLKLTALFVKDVTWHSWILSLLSYGSRRCISLWDTLLTTFFSNSSSLTWRLKGHMKQKCCDATIKMEKFCLTITSERFSQQSD